MNILTSNSMPLIQPVQKIGEQSTAADNQGVGFGDLLKQAMGEVNSLQHQSSAIKTKLVTGEIDDIHQVMIAAEKASLAFQLTVQIRTKVVEAYQEIMRMQI